LVGGVSHIGFKGLRVINKMDRVSMLFNKITAYILLKNGLYMLD
jgi:hypothetical protein